MTARMIQVGTGGQGAHWCETCLPPNVADGTVEVVAAVDLDEEAHVHAKDGLGLSDEQCYTDMERAFEAHDAEFCSCVVPVSVHETVVDAALDHDLHILSEKPIAESLEAAVRVANKVEQSDKQMAVTMSHRFRRDIRTLRRQLYSGRHGPLDYLSMRYAINARSRGSWADRLYDWEDHPLLIDGAVHHLDLLADLADSNCETIYATAWDTDWSDFSGESQALVTMEFENGKRAHYEGANTNATTLNGWNSELIRAECRDSTLILDDTELEVFPYDESEERCMGSARTGDGEVIPLDEQEKWSNAWLIEQFVDSLDGGEPMETNVRDNLQSMALVFGAIESDRRGESVDVQALLQETIDSVEG